MITDEEIDALSDDDDEAFVRYESILREAVKVRSENSPNWDAERDYVMHILAFVDTRGIALELPRNPPADDQTFRYWYLDFARTIDYYKTKLRLQLSARKKLHVSVLTLSPDHKVQIGAHLTAIRKIVSKADLSEGKRDALVRRINNLQEEVDRNRTRTEAAMALLLDVTGAISDGAKNLDPAIARMERIIKVFAKAKGENDQRRLEAPPEQKRIPPPATPEEPPALPDDETPF